MRPAAGDLRYWLELQEDTRTATPGSRGEVAESWKTRAKIKGKFEQLNANEQIVFNQQYPTASHKITARWIRQADPTPAWRIKAKINGKTRYFHIAAVENVNELNEAWVFICGEQVAVREGDT